MANTELDGAQLLAAVIAEPEDVEHRLVYADWLISQGDPQGELIQLWEQLRAGTLDIEMKQRMDQLRETLDERIAGDVATLASEYTILRGFVSRIQMDAATFAEHGERLLASSPIETLELEPYYATELAQLARAPALRGLRVLKLGQHSGFPRPTSFDDLCASPYLDSLRTLEVRSTSVHGGTQSAFSKLKAPKLESMYLYEVDSSVEILAGLGDNGSVRLRTLEVKLTAPKKWKPAFSGEAFWRLHTLRLHVEGTKIGRLFKGSKFHDLVRLELGRDVPLETLRYPNLRRLSLDAGQFARGWLPKLLCELPQLERLRIAAMPGPEVDAAHEDALRLPEDVPLTGLSLPKRDANRELAARVAQRFGRHFYDP